MSQLVKCIQFTTVNDAPHRKYVVVEMVLTKDHDVEGKSVESEHTATEEDSPSSTGNENNTCEQRGPGQEPTCPSGWQRKATSG